MVSKAAAPQTETYPHQQGGETPAQSAPAPRQNGPDGPALLKVYSITHLRRSQPSRVLINRIRATDDADAQRRAAQHFPDSTILRVCRARKGPTPTATPEAPNTEDPPNARFIRGEFRPADTEDEPTLRDLCS